MPAMKLFITLLLGIFSFAAGARSSVPGPSVPSWACAVDGNHAVPQGVVSFNASSATGVSSLRGTASKQVPPVQAVDATTLPPLLAKEDLLVAFYAPWCPHCQTFVMHDAAGNPTNAPLEVLNRDLAAANGPRAVKFDVQASTPPAQFPVDYIPKIFLARKTGEIVLYQGNPDDLAALKQFALTGQEPGSVVTVFGNMHEETSFSVSLLPSWACAMDGNHTMPQGVVSFNASSATGVSSLRGTASKQLPPVQAVDAMSLAQLRAIRTEDLLVAFYAPWCPHCRTFVLHDAAGHVDRAPLEVLNRELAAVQGPRAVKFDVQQSAAPAEFPVDFVPKIFLARKTGEILLFQGNPSDHATLKRFALNGTVPGAPVALLSNVSVAKVGSHVHS